MQIELALGLRVRCASDLRHHRDADRTHRRNSNLRAADQAPNGRSLKVS